MISIFSHLPFVKEFLEFKKERKQLLDKIEDLESDLQVSEEWNEELVAQMADLQEKMPKLSQFVEYILDGGVIFYNYNDLKKAKRLDYLIAADRLRKNEVFKNELTFLKDNAAKLCLKHSESEVDLKLYRMMVITIEMILERIEQIERPDQGDKKMTEDEKFSIL